MSYSNGLGNLQNLIGNLATNASQTSKATEQSSLSNTLTGKSVAGGLDATKISTTSNLFSQALSGSDVRVAKVAALQQTIADGTYFVSSNDVATSIIASLLG